MSAEEEYMWSCSFDKEKKEFLWNPGEPADHKEDDPKPGHRLLIKTAILMPEAKKDDVNIIQLECEGYKKKVNVSDSECHYIFACQVCVPIVAMVGGADVQRYVDLLVPCPAKLTLVSGEKIASAFEIHSFSWST